MQANRCQTFGQLARLIFQVNKPFVTTGDGLGFVHEGKVKNIFGLASRKKTKDKEADEMLDYIWSNFNMLPFALRWLLGKWEEKDARKILDILIKKRAVHAYPVLVEGNGQRVAQAEHTFIPNENGVMITTNP